MRTRLGGERTSNQRDFSVELARALIHRSIVIHIVNRFVYKESQ